MLKTNCESIVSKVSFISDFLRAIKPQITINRQNEHLELQYAGILPRLNNAPFCIFLSAQSKTNQLVILALIE